RSILNNRGKDIENFADAILADVKDFTGEVGAIDDISLLIIELAWDEAIDIIKSAKKQVIIHRYLDAIEILETGLEKYPDNLKILYNLSKNYFRVNNFNKAIQTIEQYLVRDNKNKYAYYICGAAYYQMMDYKTAIEQFNVALFIDT